MSIKKPRVSADSPEEGSEQTARYYDKASGEHDLLLKYFGNGEKVSVTELTYIRRFVPWQYRFSSNGGRHHRNAQPYDRHMTGPDDIFMCEVFYETGLTNDNAVLNLLIIYELGRGLENNVFSDLKGGAGRVIVRWQSNGMEAELRSAKRNTNANHRTYPTCVGKFQQ